MGSQREQERPWSREIRVVFCVLERHVEEVRERCLCMAMRSNLKQVRAGRGKRVSCPTRLQGVVSKGRGPGTSKRFTLYSCAGVECRGHREAEKARKKDGAMHRRETEASSQSTAIERVEQRAPTASQERPSLNDALRYHQDFQSVSEQDASSSAGPQTALLEERRGTKRSAQEVGLTASSTVPGSISMQSLRMQAHYLMETGIYSSEAREKRLDVVSY